MKKYSAFLVFILLVFSYPSYAGYSNSESDYQRFHYDVKGELDVRPDRAIFPVVITVKAQSYKKSLAIANQVFAELNAESQKLDAEVFSISAMDFSKKSKNYRKINLSFFGGDDDKNKAATKLMSFLVVSFSDQHTFADRSSYIAESLDFIENYKIKYKDKDWISVYAEESFYEIADIEQYRKKIVSSVYYKARVMADIIGKQEKLSATIHQVHFDQHISEDILSFNKATLSIGSKIEYVFK